jgi:hypothetical protein
MNSSTRTRAQTAITPTGQRFHATAMNKTRSAPEEIATHKAGTREDRLKNKNVPKMSVAISWDPAD